MFVVIFMKSEYFLGLWSRSFTYYDLKSGFGVAMPTFDYLFVFIANLFNGISNSIIIETRPIYSYSSYGVSLQEAMSVMKSRMHACMHVHVHLILYFPTFFFSFPKYQTPLSYRKCTSLLLANVI